MTIAQKQRKWTVEEFLAWHENQEARYELVDGVPVLKWPALRIRDRDGEAPRMMTGANRRYNKVSARLFKTLANQLAGSNCDAYAHDAAVRTGTDQIRYPNLIVDCGTPADEGYIFDHPRLVVEILSPSTKSFDLAAKISEYWRLPDLLYILIIDPDERRAQLHRRPTGSAGDVDLYTADAVIGLADLNVSIALADIFADLPRSAAKKR